MNCRGSDLCIKVLQLEHMLTLDSMLLSPPVLAQRFIIYFSTKCHIENDLTVFKSIRIRHGGEFDINSGALGHYIPLKLLF